MKVIEYQRDSGKKLGGLHPIFEACTKEEATHYIGEAETPEEKKKMKSQFERFTLNKIL